MGIESNHISYSIYMFLLPFRSSFLAHTRIIIFINPIEWSRNTKFGKLMGGMSSRRTSLRTFSHLLSGREIYTRKSFQPPLNHTISQINQIAFWLDTPRTFYRSHNEWMVTHLYFFKIVVCVRVCQHVMIFNTVYLSKHSKNISKNGKKDANQFNKSFDFEHFSGSWVGRWLQSSVLYSLKNVY